jgi:hypothetical protein
MLMGHPVPEQAGGSSCGFSDTDMALDLVKSDAQHVSEVVIACNLQSMRLPE